MIKDFLNTKKISRGIFTITGLFVFLIATNVNAVISDVQIDTDNIDENTASGTAIGTLSTTGGNSPYTYELTNGTGDEDNSKFVIDGDELKLNFTPDYENPTDLGDIVGNNTYATRVSVTDTGETAITTDGDDYSSAYNHHGGFYNADNHPNLYAFATINSDNSISAWGTSGYGGTSPSGTGYTQIYSNTRAFAALKSDGSITAWGYGNYGGTGAPTGTGFTQIYSTEAAFAALDSYGSITAWGSATKGGTSPSGTGYTKLYSTKAAFAALKSDGSITAWGLSSYGGISPSGTGYTKIYSTMYAFAALNSDGSITAWGGSGYGGTSPSGTGFIKIYSTEEAFAALNSDGSITAWGSNSYGGISPSGIGYTKIYSTERAFAALKSDGSITAWGGIGYGNTAPSGMGYTQIYSNTRAFAALKSDGSITAWGGNNYGNTAPSGTGYTKIYSTQRAFAALKSDGSITAWGDSDYGGTAPSGTGYTKLYSTERAFAALKSDGSITVWGNGSYGGLNAPTGVGHSIPYGGGIETTLPGNEYEEQLIVSVNDLEETVVILNPDSTEMKAVVNNGYIITDNDINTSEITEATTQVQVTFQSNTANAIFPASTLIREASLEGESFEFKSFITQNTLAQVKATYPVYSNAIGAVRIGVPTKDLVFTNNLVTIEIAVSSAYNGMTMDVFSQLESTGVWSSETTCTITNGTCTFTTDHATTYVVNGDGSISGYDEIDINVEVQETLSLDCYDKAGTSGDHDVTLGTSGIVTAGTPVTGESTCNVTTNDDQGYYLTVINSTNGGTPQGTATEVLRHEDPNNSGTWYSIDDITAWDDTTIGGQTGLSTWTNGTTTGLGFSVTSFPEASLTNNEFENTWVDGTCGEASNQYAGIPTSAQAISAVTSYQETSTSTDICYKVDISPSQPSGVYTGQVTYTATSDASSYYK